MDEFWLKNNTLSDFFATQCSLIIRGFSIRGTLTERIYRELRGPPVLGSYCALASSGLIIALYNAIALYNKVLLGRD